MSKLFIEQQEISSLNVNQIHQDLPTIEEPSENKVDQDLIDAWIEVFAEDRVQVLEALKC